MHKNQPPEGEDTPRLPHWPYLPASFASLIGREQERARLRELLDQPEIRLVTLTGVGGVGKTRLALSVAADLRAHFADGIVTVDLAPLTEPLLVGHTIAQRLQIKIGTGENIIECLVRHLHAKQLLLMLDNFEHILEAASLLAQLLAACPALKLLVTSRAPTHLLAEHEFPLSPLVVPPPGLPITPTDLSQYPAIALFVQRAQAVQPDFQLTETNAVAVAEICRRLDGLPLALELAAARIKTFAPLTLLRRLDRRLALLTRDTPDLPVRHQTLRKTLDWSHSLLTEPEQRLFRRLAAFRGGWTLEAAETVTALEHTPDLSLEHLASLVDKSLLQSREQPDATSRFTMLETVREYALEQLQASGEAEAVQRQHLAYFLTLAETAEPFLWGSEQTYWLDRLEQEHDNLRTALGWALDHGAVEQALRLATALARFWPARDHLLEGCQWLQLVVDLPGDASPAIRARALVEIGRLSRVRANSVQAITHLEEALLLWRALGDTLNVARVLNLLGVLSRDQGVPDRTMTFCTESLALFREHGDEQGVALALFSLGVAARMRGEIQVAEECLRESLIHFKRLGDAREVAWSHTYLGQTALDRNDTAAAKRWLEQAMRLHQQVAATWGVAMTLSYQGMLATAEGDAIKGLQLHQESLRLRREIGFNMRVPETLEELAKAAITLTGPAPVARLLGAAAALRETLITSRPPADQAAYEQLLAEVRARLAETAFVAAWREGQVLTLDEAVAEALEIAPALLHEHTDIASSPADLKAKSAPARLTRREQEVAALIARGLTNRQIGEVLAISEGTVGIHVEHILDKLDVRSRAQVAAWVVEHGLHSA